MAWLLTFAGVFLELPISQLLYAPSQPPVSVAIQDNLGNYHFGVGMAQAVIAVAVAFARRRGRARRLPAARAGRLAPDRSGRAWLSGSSIEHVSQGLPGRQPRARRPLARGRAGDVPRAARTVRLGQDDAAALHRRDRADERRAGSRSASALVADERIHVPPERRDLAMVFQDYALWPHLVARDNVAFALRRHGLGRAECARGATEMLERVGLGALADRYPSQLSGGEQQRVALARALVAEMGLVLCDEPLSNLDADLRERMRVEISSLDPRDRARRPSTSPTTRPRPSRSPTASACSSRAGSSSSGAPEEIYTVAGDRVRRPLHRARRRAAGARARARRRRTARVEVEPTRPRARAAAPRALASSPDPLPDDGAARDPPDRGAALRARRRRAPRRSGRSPTSPSATAATSTRSTSRARRGSTTCSRRRASGAARRSGCASSPPAACSSPPADPRALPADSERPPCGAVSRGGAGPRRPLPPHSPQLPVVGRRRECVGLLEHALALVHELAAGLDGRVGELRVPELVLDRGRERVTRSLPRLVICDVSALVGAVVLRRAGLQRRRVGLEDVGAELPDARVELLVADGQRLELPLSRSCPGANVMTSVMTRPSST